MLGRILLTLCVASVLSAVAGCARPACGRWEPATTEARASSAGDVAAVSAHRSPGSERDSGSFDPPAAATTAAEPPPTTAPSPPEPGPAATSADPAEEGPDTNTAVDATTKTADATAAAARRRRARAKALGAAARTFYKSRCAHCHGARGRGDGPVGVAMKPKPRSFADHVWQKSVSNRDIERIMVRGGAAVGKSPLMPPHPDLAKRPELVDALRRLIRRFGRR